MKKDPAEKQKIEKSTLEQIAAAQQLIVDFFDEYSVSKHINLSFEVFCICALDENFGTSANGKKTITDYLTAVEKVINAARLLTDPSFLQQQYDIDPPVDEGKAKQIKQVVERLSNPFWKHIVDKSSIGRRLKQEEYGDITALSDVDKDDLLSRDIGLSFFIHYGLKESLELLDNLFACFAPFKGLGKARQREIADFYGALKDLLSATYLQSIQRWKELPEVEEGEDYAR